MAKRKYTKTRRAEQQDETRERIVEAAVALHEQLGPANTSIKAIAEKAGVQRHSGLDDFFSSPVLLFCPTGFSVFPLIHIQ